MKVLLDKDIAIAMKLALEYNAAIITLATAYYGNMDSRISQKNFRKNLKAIQADYSKRLNEALDMVEDESKADL